MRKFKGFILFISVWIWPFLTNAQTYLPIANSSDKFLGNIYSSSQLLNFNQYWNQVTPENAGKWGSVESVRDQMNWSELDKAYKLAKDNKFPFKFHVLIWGNQQPSWIENLTPEQQLIEIKQWFQLVSKRYPAIDFIEVVNEPLNDPPNQSGSGGGNYINALGGTGETGWDWVINSFKLAREYFPNSKLMMNDYNIINNSENTKRYINIINLLKKDSLIDQIGFQAHAFSTTGASATMQANLDLLAATKLPIYVTEMDIDGSTDLAHLQGYQRIFPIFWEHPSIKGITCWGWRNGMWRSEQKAYLMNISGTERPAMVWLRKYVNGSWVSTQSIRIEGDNLKKTIDINQGTLQLNAIFNPDTASIQTVIWNVNNSKIASIDSNGLLKALTDGNITITAKAQDGSNKSATFVVKISNQSTVGIQERSNSADIKIYPNPSLNGKFFIESPEDYHMIEVFNLSGKSLLKVQKESDLTQIHLDAEPGMYLIKLTGKQSPMIQKVIIE